MKHLLRFIVFIPLLSYGQTVIYNQDLLDSSKHQLFQFVRNNLIVRSNQNLQNIKLIGLKSSIQPIDKNTFRVYVNKRGTDTLKLYAGNKLIYVAAYQLDTVPDPIVRVGKFLDTLLTINQILLNPFLSVMFPGSNYRGGYFVFSFSMEVQKQSQEFSIQEMGENSRLSARQSNVIKDLQSGDKLYFSEIRGGGPDSRLIKFPPFTITIK